MSHDVRMEDHLIDAATADLLVKVGWYAATAIFTGVASIIGTLLWGRGGRKRLMEDNRSLKERMAALEARASQPGIKQAFNFHAGADPHDLAGRLRDEMEGQTVRGLRETMRGLSQHPMGDGHTYARLPEGTVIVSMADGTYRLATPVDVVIGAVSLPTATATLSVEVGDKDDA